MKTRKSKWGGREANKRLYGIWRNMRYRCNNPFAREWKYYGGRGISICPKWETNYSAFHDWAIANGYADNLQVDRINNNGNYEPRNCRWVTPRQNQRNRSNVMTEAQRQAIIMLASVPGCNKSEIARSIGVSRPSIYDALKYSEPEYSI